jgi:hypothetical protein
MTTLKCSTQPVKINEGTPKGLGALSAPVALTPHGCEGALGAFGKIERQPAVSARIFVGLSRGVSSGPCEGKPETYPVAAVDASIVDQRSAQVGPQNAGATRFLAKGVYNGKPESTAVYELWPAKGESKAAFKARVRDVAETTGKRFCQVEVGIAHTDGGKLVRESAVYEGAKKGRKP